jgi:Zn-dependent protease with chaperone function
MSTLKGRFFCALLLILGAVNGQNLPFGPLRCQGPVPPAFLQSSSAKAMQNVQAIDKQSKNRKEITEEEEFALATTFVIDEILKSGKVLYGDTITQYIQKVADGLLSQKPELKQQLNFFTLKSNLVNAISTHQGYIFVTTGLLSHLHNEAELAFVLAHEIAHFTQKHSLASAKLKNRLFDEKNESDGLEERVKTVYQYSRENEMEADKLGMELFLSAGYGFDFGLDALALLEHADEHIVNVQANPAWFESGYWKIQRTDLPPGGQLSVPGKMDANAAFEWPKSFPEIPAPEAGDAAFKTHPDVVDRLRQVEEIFKAEFDKPIQKDPYKFTNAAYFQHVQQRAWVEDVVSHLRQANFVDAMYLGYALDSLMPNQSFSADAKAMAWYGLLHHKVNAEDLNAFGLYDDLRNLNAPQVRDLNEVLKGLSKEQLSIMAVRNIALDIQKRGSSTFRRNLLDSCIKLMLSNPTFEMYNYSIKMEDAVKDGNAKWRSAFAELGLAEISGYLYFKRLRSKDSLVLQEELNKENQKKKLLNKVLENNLTHLQTQRLGIDSLWMFTPNYDQLELNGSGKVSRDYIRDEAIAQTFESDYQEAAIAARVDLAILKNMGSSNLTTEDVNRFAMMQDWMEERLNNGLTQMMLFETGIMQSALKHERIGHLAWAGAVNTIEARKFNALYMAIAIVYTPALPYYIYWQSTKSKKFQFMILVFNPKTGEIDGVFLKKYSADWSRDFLRSHLYDIMLQIKTKPKTIKGKGGRA